MFSVLRMGDPVTCICFPVGGTIPCPNGFVTEGSFNTFIEDKAVARVGDRTSNCCGGQCLCPNYILTGSFTTYEGDKGIARTIDKISCGIASQGSFTTYVS
jgi:uncharacterized Zn-binding protein involved in type VI secretion